MAPVVLVLLFVGSGAAALVYEVVWQQLLQLVIGSSTVSLGVLLGVFMGGMSLGSLLAPRLVPKRFSALRIYALLEAGIGVMALVLLFAMPVVTRVYEAVGGLGTSGVVMRALVAGVCLLPPTFAMGATLPVMARWIDARADDRSWLGFLYAGNLAGAVFGCLLAGFYLLRVYDMAIATYVAVVINAIVALTAWAVDRNAVNKEVSVPAQGVSLDAIAGQEGPPAINADTSQQLSARTRIYVAIAASGFCALAAEVVWTRMLALVFGATVYTFSIVLAIFLVGLGLGSTAGAALVRRSRTAIETLGWCQLLTAVCIAWSTRALSTQLPFWPANATDGADIWSVFRVDTLRGLYAIMPAPLLWGASFPLALAAAMKGSSNSDALVGRVYAANTIGAIAGALGTSLLFVPWLGSQHTQQMMMAIAVASGLLLLVPPPARSGTRVTGIGVSLALVWLVTLVPALPAILVAYGRHSAAWAGHAGEIIYVGEGTHASIAVSRRENGVLNYHNAGKIQASSEPADMRLQRMLGHLTTLVPSRPRSVLVIGCGAGVTAGAVSVNPAVERVTIVDIEPLVPRVAAQFMGPVNHDVLTNPKVRVIADDARHFLQTTTEKFDAITSDPLDPWVKGAATLYTREFFETARRHLNPGGVMTLYVQLFESSHEAVKSEVATFFEAFPEGLIFGNVFEGKAIDSVLLGQAEAPEIWLDEIEATLRTPAFARVDSSLIQVGIYGATELFGNYAGRARDLRGWLAGASINRDRDLRLQYLAGLGLNQHSGDDIYREILAYRTFPDDLFVASESTLGRLQDAMSGVRE
jgi:spermidine synthase